MKKLIIILTLTLSLSLLTSKKSNAEVFFQGGGGASYFMDIDLDQDVLPGAYLAMGFKDKSTAIRAYSHILIWNNDDDPHIPIPGGGLDLQIFSPAILKEKLKGYLILGAGYHFPFFFGANLGLGIDFKIHEKISLGIENTFRPIWNPFGDSWEDNDGSWFYMYNAMGVLTYHF